MLDLFTCLLLASLIQLDVDAHPGGDPRQDWKRESIPCSSTRLNITDLPDFTFIPINTSTVESTVSCTGTSTFSNSTSASLLTPSSDFTTASSSIEPIGIITVTGTTTLTSTHTQTITTLVTRNSTSTANPTITSSLVLAITLNLTSSAVLSIRPNLTSSAVLSTSPNLTSTAALSSSSALSSSRSIQRIALPASTSAPSALFINAAYFTNWGTIDRDYYPNDLPVDQLTHIFYAFAIQNADGGVTSSNPGIDAICVGQLSLLKRKNRSLKVILSIGGWDASQDGSFSALTSSADKRNAFVSNAVAMMQAYGFDGIDIDWEYPENDTDAANFVLLVQELREALDTLGSQHNKYHFLLTVACPAGPNKFNLWHLADMVPFIDFFDFMGYDYMGPGFSTMSGHQANLYKSSINPTSTDYETQSAISYYITAGVPPSKIVLGMPLYGRSFEDTQLGRPFTISTNGSQSYAASGDGAGVWEYKGLPKAGATEIYAADSGATYSYDSNTGELISYDNVDMVSRKVDYLLSVGLGGAFFWEASTDRTDENSLILTSANKLRAAGGLDNTKNLLFY